MSKAKKTGFAESLVEHVSKSLEQLRDPEIAAGMAAYMRTEMPFYGVQKPDRVPIVREIKKKFHPASRDEYEAGVSLLWIQPHREEKYFAINYASSFREFITKESFPLYERMIREGAWWDLVDGTTGELIGPAYLKQRKEIRGIINKWSRDKDMWIRRSSIISQLGHKGETDSEQLFEICLRLAPEKEFFIQKAIGWAMREYSKTDPKAVKSFLNKNKSVLAPLSYREGAKHLIKMGEMKMAPSSQQ